MLIQEFTELTGFEPTIEEYQEIEAEYYRFDGDKRAFCEDFVARGGEKQVYAHRAQYIKELESQLMDQEKEYTARLANQEEAYADQILKLTARVAQLQEALDRELDWQLTNSAGTKMDQEEYDDLLRHGEVLNCAQAVNIVCKEYGFAWGRVEIKKEVSTYQKNKRGELREKERMEREPVYSSTDWNYIRFDCAGLQYEMINGELVKYEV